MLRLHLQIRSTVFRAFAVALAVTYGITGARAQSPIIAVGPPSFQSNAYPSLQTDIVQRIATTGQMQPGDLPNLTRLMALQSVAMLAEIRADMPGSLTGNRLEGQVRQLWDATQVMSETVGTAPLDSQALNLVQEKYADVENAYRQVESTLGELPGISNRASAHLRGLSQLTAATGSVMLAIEADLPAPVRLAPERQPDMEQLRTQARLLSNDIVGLAAKVKSSKQRGSGWDTVVRDLDELFGSTQDFQHALSPVSSTEQIQSSFRAIRRRVSRVEARIAQLGWSADLARSWRGMRDILNQINNEVGLPRVIDRASTVRPSAVTAAGSAARPVARIYRGSE
jgi:hypothetical protein